MKKKSTVNTATRPGPRGPKNTCSCGNVAKVGTNKGPKCYWCWIGNATRYYKLYGPNGLKDEPNRILKDCDARPDNTR